MPPAPIPLEPARAVITDFYHEQYPIPNILAYLQDHGYPTLSHRTLNRRLKAWGLAKTRDYFSGHYTGQQLKAKLGREGFAVGSIYTLARYRRNVLGLHKRTTSSNQAQQDQSCYIQTAVS